METKIDGDFVKGEGVVIQLQPGKEDFREPEPAPEMVTSTKDDAVIRKQILKIKLIFLVLGVLSLLPWNIFVNAEGFFRKKLANSMFEDNFSLYLQAFAVFSNLLGSFLMFFLSKKFTPRVLVVASAIAFTLPLVVITALAKINTDTWPKEFFMTVLIMYSINGASHGLMTSSHSILSTMIDATILKTYYVGKGLAGLVGSAIALSTLAFPSLDVVSAAFYYFLVMTLLSLFVGVGLTLYLLNLDLVKERTIAANYKQEETHNDAAMSLGEITRELKPQCISALLSTISSLVVFPATITNLKSMNPKTGTAWSDKFFLPVTVFLVWAVGDNAGKILTEFCNWPTKDTIVWFSVARLVLVPLVVMTNIQPRTIPVWFKSDAIPSILCFLTAFTGGYLVNLNLTYAPGYVEGKENKGRASMVMFFFLAGGLAVGSGTIFLIPVILNP